MGETAMKKVLCKNIVWDTDGKKVALPKEVEVEVEDPTNDEEIGDALSDKIGFCHHGFDFTVVSQD